MFDLIDSVVLSSAYNQIGSGEIGIVDHPSVYWSISTSMTMGDKVPFIVVQTVVPVVDILWEVHLFSGPKRCFGFLVNLPYLIAGKPPFIRYRQDVLTLWYFIGKSMNQCLDSFKSSSSPMEGWMMSVHMTRTNLHSGRSTSPNFVWTTSNLSCSESDSSLTVLGETEHFLSLSRGSLSKCGFEGVSSVKAAMASTAWRRVRGGVVGE